MNALEKCLRMSMSFYEIGANLSVLPSPRRSFFNGIVSVSGLTPNTVKMMLCNTGLRYVPSESKQRIIAEYLNADIERLFPAEMQDGCLADIYRNLSGRKVEYNHFINQVAVAARASPKTVVKWLKQQRVPNGFVRRRIAEVISVSIFQLFPDEEGFK